MAKSSSLSKTAVWILLALLIFGLAGFGATNLSGTLRTIGSVGDKPVTTQAYYNGLQQEMANVARQTGQQMTFQQAREVGLDQAVLNRIVTTRALDHEATELGLSVGDEQVRDQILAISNFQGLDGQFDREAYSYALENQGLNESEFEDTLREETARTLLQGAVISGLDMPAAFADLLVAYAGEQRSFSWSVLDASLLGAALEPADEDDLKAFYEANTDQFQLPETKRITYILLSPDMLVDGIELDEDTLRQSYQDRLGEYNQPERRLVERLVYLEEQAAKDAAAQLEVGGTTFETLVEDRGLTLADIDLGDVGRLELDAAGEAVFSGDVGDVVGPLPSSLGPALFRINGILPAQSVSYEEALPELREGLATARARRLIEAEAENLNDLLAGGATLEDLAAEGDPVLGTIDWSAESGEGIAAYETFRLSAAQLEADDFAVIEALEDGSVFAMRLDEELPQRPEPFEDARDAVSAALEISRTEEALRAQADVYIPQLVEGATFADLGLTSTEEVDRTRGAFVPRAPAGFLQAVFEMDQDEVRSVDGNGTVVLVRLDSIDGAADSDEAQQLKGVLQNTLNQAIAQDIFDIYTNEVTLRAGPQIDPRALEAVHANLP